MLAIVLTLGTLYFGWILVVLAMLAQGDLRTKQEFFGKLFIVPMLYNEFKKLK